MVDTALAFGSRLTPKLFNKLTQAVRRMMHRRGFAGIITYLDDFLVIEKSMDRCIEAQHTLITIFIVISYIRFLNRMGYS